MRIDIDIPALLPAYGVHVASPGERHYRRGWIAMPCPFCSGGAGNHLGYSERYKIFTCWRCGRHTVGEVLAAITGLSKGEAVEMALRDYPGDGAITCAPEIVRPDNIRIPGSRKPSDIHTEYLENRRFDTEELVNEYDVRFTTTEYPRNRIVFPVIHFGRPVSYVARTVVEDHLRYLVCRDELEVRKAKHCIWGANRVSGDSVIVVEGIFDALRIGPGAVATLGTAWTPEQAREIAKYRRSYIMFDNTDTAQDAGRRLAETVCSLGAESYRVRVAEFKDPGEFSPGMVEKVRGRFLSP